MFLPRVGEGAARSVRAAIIFCKTEPDIGRKLHASFPMEITNKMYEIHTYTFNNLLLSDCYVLGTVVVEMIIMDSLP